MRPYVYTALYKLVALHTELSTTAEGLTTPVLTALFEVICKALLDAFKKRATTSNTVAASQHRSASGSRSRNRSASPPKQAEARFPLPALMQATLDVEFFAQTLGSQYGTEKASQYQSQVYVELDKAGDARALQGELPEMRTILKRLKEGTRGGFGCFRKERKEGERSKSRAGGRAGE